MSATWDPEIVELLHEIVRDKRSTLAELPPPTVGEYLRPHTLSANAPFLSKAERQLLSVHRETVAKLLEDAAFSTMFGPNGWTDRCTDFVTNTERARIPSTGELSSRTTRLPDLTGTEEADLANQGAALMRRWVRGSDFGQPTVGQLLIHSTRLEPAFRARLLLVLWLGVTGQGHSATRLGRCLAASGQRPRSRSDALQYLALVHHEQGSFGLAVEELSTATRLIDGYAVLICGLLVNAVLALDSVTAQRSLLDLGQVSGDQTAIAAVFAKSLRARRWARGGGQLSGVRALAKELVGLGDGPATSILLTLASEQSDERR